MAYVGPIKTRIQQLTELEKERNIERLRTILKSEAVTWTECPECQVKWLPMAASAEIECPFCQAEISQKSDFTEGERPDHEALLEEDDHEFVAYLNKTLVK